MFWSILTVGCYTISSLGDKFISAKLKYKANEFAFFVALATSVWLGIMLIFDGWKFKASVENILVLACLVAWKLGEFYSSAVLLKIVSAYELKAWLGINVIISYMYNVINGKYKLSGIIIIFSVILMAGIALIIAESSQNKKILKLILLSIVYSLSKFLYGLQMGMLSKDSSPISTLFAVMIVIVLFQLPNVNVKEMFNKTGVSMGVLSRIPNAAGLFTEALAAKHSILFYAMIQPMQQLVLFVHSIFIKENMGKKKLTGSILSLISVVAIAILTLFYTY